MGITTHLDELLRLRGVTAKELCQKVGITEANLSILRSGKAKKNDPPIPEDLAPISGSGKRAKEEENQEEKRFVLDSIRIKYSEETIAEEIAPEEAVEEEKAAKSGNNRRRRNRKPGNKPQQEKQFMLNTPTIHTET